MGQGENALKYGTISMKFAEGLEPFYSGFAYEALARAEIVAGNKVRMDEYPEKAHAFAEKLADKEDRQVLLNDLGSIK